jgi:hypothetical protein
VRGDFSPGPSVHDATQSAYPLDKIGQCRRGDVRVHAQQVETDCLECGDRGVSAAEHLGAHAYLLGLALEFAENPRRVIDWPGDADRRQLLAAAMTWSMCIESHS